MLTHLQRMKDTVRPVILEVHIDRNNSYYRVSFIPDGADSFFAVSIDITDIKQAQHQAERERARLQTIRQPTGWGIGGRCQWNKDTSSGTGSCTDIWGATLDQSTIRHGTLPHLPPRNDVRLRAEEMPVAEGLPPRARPSLRRSLRY